MKKNILVFLLFFQFSASISSQNWTILIPPNFSRFDDVFFLADKLNGWACNGNGEIYHTLDGGQTWEIQFDAGVYLRSIEFLDENIGFCGALSTTKSLYKTIDGGKTWVDYSAQIPNLSDGICGLCSPNSQTIYGVGVWSLPAYFIKSTDGGKTFDYFDMSNYASSLVDVYFVTPDSGFICGQAKNLANGGIILSTSDGGLTWHTKMLTGVKYDYVWKIQTPDVKHFFASIERVGLSTIPTEISKSSDFGQTWILKTVDPSLYRLQMIGFLDSLKGFTGDKKLFKTIDGGDHWIKIANQTGSGFDRFHRLDEQTAIVSGYQLYRLNWGISATEYPSNPFEEKKVMHLLGNPVSNNSKIRLNLDSESYVSLRILPITGQNEVINIFSGRKSAGESSFSLPINTLSKGAYYLFLKTNYGTEDILFEVF
jgi:photosystem II stability/assembly factor-like uncharacterized protein